MDDMISRQAAIDAIGEKADEIYKTKQKGATYPHNDFFLGMAYAEDIVKQLPPAQPDKSIVEDCLYRIYRNTSVYTATEGRVTIKHYMGELWRELFGEEDMPEWMS